MTLRNCFFLVSAATLALAAQYKQPPPVPALVTYRQDVQPILAKHCEGCHSPGHMGPMALNSYEAARPWTQQIKATVQSKKMPPAVTSPHYILFSSDDALTPQQIDIVVKWVDGGAAEGTMEPAKRPARRK